VEAAAAADYLERCLPPAPGPVWEQILTGLRQSTLGASSDASPQMPVSAVAQVAATPLGLWLLRTVYIGPGADPTPLTDSDRFLSTGALRAHLLDRLIPALITTHPPARRSRRDPDEPFWPCRAHDPDQVRRWLGYLAHHLAHPRNADHTPRTRDFIWWHLARPTFAPHRTASLAGGLAFGVAFRLAGVLKGGLAFGLALGLTGGLGVRMCVAD
jgi:hypothetical protein